MKRSKVKAGHTRYFTVDGQVVVTLKIISRKQSGGLHANARFLVRDDLYGDYLIYRLDTILRNTYPTYRKAQRSVVQYTH